MAGKEAGETDIWGQSKNTVELIGGAGLLLSIFTLTPNIRSESGGIGRRAGFRIQWGNP